MKTCPRCDAEGCSVVAQSPVESCWEIYSCPRCFFTWRTTESPTITDGSRYNQKFKLTVEKLHHFHDVPAIPPLRKL
ncbi:non-oxidative hydroxyarylic acid decarboxylases subunit D [Ktedonospora formicarum]|uniref:non-oxidative hydroxyarylic acid decarboxylases subunit D n=1 Tax=Ktedonospora formicarum TaxID=2778364 RepID=UPI0022A7FB74|nr:non-oxidative hydroxyarylic acid decarboxylases subunit D [Ktedonospora formicarum]